MRKISRTVHEVIAGSWPFVALLALGITSRCAERRIAWQKPAELGVDRDARRSGNATLLSRAGGMRVAAANLFWLQANIAWERQDIARTMSCIDLTVAADARPIYFWLNGARIIAYDVPQWRLAGLQAPAVVRQRVIEEQAHHALAFLERGLRSHGSAADIHVEMANIHLRQLGEIGRAAACYRLAAEQAGAPYYAARIHGELLCAMGRSDEALQWLKEIFPHLPPGDPAAGRATVLARIEALENRRRARDRDDHEIVRLFEKL
jgi:hypothetical protein